MSPKIVMTVKLLVVAVVFLVLWNIPSTSFGIDGLTILQQRMIAIFAFAALMWILEAVPAWVTSVLVMAIMIFTVSNGAPTFFINPADFPADQLVTDDAGVSKVGNLVPYTSIMACLADKTIMLFLAGFVIADVASKSHVDVTLARGVLKLFGTKSNNVLLGFILVTAVCSMFVSNTATAAMMLTFLAPVLKSLPDGEKGRAALALAIPIGANIGGIGTPIGTPPNAIALGYINRAVNEGGLGCDISFGQWMMVMTPLMLVILFIAWFLLKSMFGFTAKNIELKIEGGAANTWQTKAIYIVIGITILLWIFGENIGLNTYVVSYFPIAAFAVLGILKAKDLQDLDWAVLWMVAGGFALGNGMESTGLAKALVENIPFDSWPVIVVLLGSCIICWTLSQFISNTAAAALMVPILVAVCSGMQSQLASIGGEATVLLGIALSASFAMALPISTPPNAIAYSTGLVKTSQMATVGVILGVIAMALGFGTIVYMGKLGVF